MKNGISDAVRRKTADVLADLLASTYSLYLKTQHAHWNIVGAEFFALHIMLEKQYEEMADGVDEIAERIRSLGHAAEGSFHAFAKRSWLSDTAAKGHFVKNLLDQHERLALQARPYILKFQEWGDDISADLLIRRLNQHEKAAWMLRSSLR